MGMPDHLSRHWVLDCDNPEAMAEGLFDLPPPNWIVWRPANDHAHACWTLAYPVHRYPEARIGPLRYLAYIAEYFAYAVGADPSYAGVLAHNPAPTRETPYETVWGREEPYTLDQLANVISFGWKPPKVRQTGIGRNVDLFEAGMQWAGRIGNADRQVITVLMVGNQEFTYLLPLSEVQATARSIEKYRNRWAAGSWHSPRWLARQAARGRKGGRPRLYELGREPWTLEGSESPNVGAKTEGQIVTQKPTQIRAGRPADYGIRSSPVSSSAQRSGGW